VQFQNYVTIHFYHINMMAPVMHTSQHVIRIENDTGQQMYSWTTQTTRK